MAKKTLGYVQLEWTCPRCSTRNPGPQKFCNGCGGPQPTDVQFTQAAEEKLLTDQSEIAKAKAGPDVHCPYCEARNPAGAKFCGACGGKLEGGQARQAGRVVGAHRTGPAQPVACPACGSQNQAGAARCANCGASLEGPPAQPKPAAPAAGMPRRVVMGGIGALAAIGCLAIALFVILANRTHALQGVVDEVRWSRTIPIEALTVVEREDWRDSIPSGALLGACRYEYRNTQDQPAPISTEVCGTPYSVDTGSGYAEVVQDCVYEVYDEWCSYQAEDWQVIDSAVASGSDLSPYWPSLSLASGQRQGEPGEEYTVVFTTDDGPVEYQARDETEFAGFAVGSSWELEINALGGVTSVTPAR